MSPYLYLADEQQMEQALINIVKNAIEAIEQNGTVTFTTTSHPNSRRTVRLRERH